jgi:large subunit ribosomal protein L25
MSETNDKAYGQLDAQVRKSQGKGVARKLRAQGLIPGVVYGRGGDNVMIAVSPALLRKAMDPDKKANTFFSLTLKDGDQETVESCVLRDYQAHATRDEFLHVDFLRVDENTEVTATIPVEYVGRAVGVVAGGKLRTYARTVKVAAKPAEIPVKLTVDVSPLEAGQTLRLRELGLPNARLLDHPNNVMANVDPPRAKKEEKQ